MEAYYPMLENALGMFLFLGIELSVLFILISAAVSLLQQYIPDEKIQAILGKSGGRGYILGAIIGAVTPFCSCSTIPMLRGLLKAKAGFGPTLTFLFTSPLLNPIILGIFVATFGLQTASIYALVALIVSIVAGFVLDKMGFERYIIPEGEAKASASCCSTEAKKTEATSCCAPVQEPSCCEAQNLENSCETSCGAEVQTSTLTFSEKVRLAFSAAWTQFKQVFPYLLFGVVLGSFVYGFVPSDFIARYASGDSLFAVPFAALIGIPLYVRVEALIPLSAVLVEKGMGLGAVMALIVGGGGASLTELILLKSMFKTPMIIAFLVVILGMAVLAGYLFQFAF